MTLSIVEPTELVTLTQCPRKWYYSYKKRLRSKKIDPKLYLGSAVHQALDTYYETFEPDEAINQYRKYVADTEKEIIRSSPNFGPEEYAEFKEANVLGEAMLVNYLSWAPAQDERDIGEVLSTEQPWEIPMDNLGIVLAGRFDMVTLDNYGRTIVWDHKTAKQFLKPELLRKDLQMQLYSLAAQYLYRHGSTLSSVVAGVRVNQLRKSNPATARVAVIKRDLIPGSNWALDQTEKTLKHLLVLRDYCYDYGESLIFPAMACTWQCRYSSICEVANAGGDPSSIIADEYITIDRTPNYLRGVDTDDE